MLNPIMIKGLSPQSKKYQVADTGGLVLVIYPNGRKVFYAEYKIKGQKIKKVIGAYPDISLTDARLEVQKLKEKTLIKEYELDQAVHKGMPFSDAVKKWLDLKSAKISEKHLIRVKGRIENHLMPSLGDKPIDAITAPMLISVVSPLAEQGKYETLKMVVGIYNEIANWLIAGGFLQFNPCASVIKYFGSGKVTNRPTIDAAELYMLIPLLEGNSIDYQMKNFLLFSIISMLRPIENTLLKWSWIDYKNKVINIPAEIMKMR